MSINQPTNKEREREREREGKGERDWKGERGSVSASVIERGRERESKH